MCPVVLFALRQIDWSEIMRLSFEAFRPVKIRMVQDEEEQERVERDTASTLHRNFTGISDKNFGGKHHLDSISKEKGEVPDFSKYHFHFFHK